MAELQGYIYSVDLLGRSDTWEDAYARAIEASKPAYQAKHGGDPTIVQLPSCIDPAALDLNGLQVMKQPIGRGSLALWGVEEIEQPAPPPENGKEGVYVCRQCEAEAIDTAVAECWACGYDGRKDGR